MKSMQELMQTINSRTGNHRDLTSEEREQIKVNNYNKSESTSDYFYNTCYDCPECKNKGDIAFLNENGDFELKRCKCNNVRKSIMRIKKSGIYHLIDKYTMNNYNTSEKWQEGIKNKALQFIDDATGNWFFIGGQVGSGKTMICTAIVAEFLNRGKASLYMLWRDEIVTLKASVTDAEEYSNRISELKNVPVLYIDDFLKVEKGKMPTPADINIAFELLNYRYNNPELITIISSELPVTDIIKIDEAVGSRIYERSKNYQININPDINKNYRLR